jgi:hopene-associated glycosyltransferase HpnB
LNTFGFSFQKDAQMAQFIAASVFAAWLYLLCARGGFWRCSQRDDWNEMKLSAWPPVIAIVPARDEAAQIAASIGSLLDQDYRGEFTVVLVDDESSDATAETAMRTAASKAGDRLHVIRSKPLPSGWTGKLWALKQGIDVAAALARKPDYLLLTDADIVHAPDSVGRLVTHAHANGLVLLSLMAKLRCESLAERAFVPAFIFFFQMIYPFAWVNAPRSTCAAAAGGCMLVHADSLARAGGIAVIRDALIDDCALANVLKRQGPIGLALTERARSIRRYPSAQAIRDMIARSAYAQLRYSPLLLAATAAALLLGFLAPVLIAILASGTARLLAVATCALMLIAYQPVLRFYRLSPFWALALPFVAMLYLVFTFDSAYQHARRRGGAWKGRVQAEVSRS